MSHKSQYQLQEHESMFDGPLMLRVNLHTVVTIDSKGNKFVTGVKIKTIGDFKLNESPDLQYF